jgi:hypothetical protein
VATSNGRRRGRERRASLPPRGRRSKPLPRRVALGAQRGTHHVEFKSTVRLKCERPAVGIRVIGYYFIDSNLTWLSLRHILRVFSGPSCQPMLVSVTRRAALAVHGVRCVTSGAMVHLPVLCGIAKWNVRGENGKEELAKKFRFPSERDAKRFALQLEDLASHVAKAKGRSKRLLSTLSSNVVDVVVVGTAGPDADALEDSALVSEPPPIVIGGQLSERDVSVAEAVDDLGSALQLQGRWN